MSNVFVYRGLETRLPRVGDYSRSIGRRYTRSQPHMTLAKSIVGHRVELESIPQIMRDSPDSAKSPITVPIGEIITVGVRANVASLAIRLAEEDMILDEINYYNDYFGTNQPVLPHITIARSIPYAEIDQQKQKIAKKFDTIDTVKLRPVTVRFKPKRNIDPMSKTA